MNIDQVFPSKYIKSSDLKGRKVKLQIDRVTVEELNDERKPIVYFEGKDKGMVLNRTNSDTITSVYGTETDDWSGKEVTLYTARVSYKGTIVDGVRVELPEKKFEAGDEDIPF
jgi:hypothetical protein